jgi:hypothetical protein
MNLSRRQFLGLLPAIPVAARILMQPGNLEPPQVVEHDLSNVPLYPMSGVHPDGTQAWPVDDTIEVATTTGTKTVPCPDYRRFGSGVNIYTG